MAAAVVLFHVNKHPLLYLAATAGLLLGPELAVAQAGHALGDASFLSAYFFYSKPDKVIVEETTPTEDQIRFYGRPDVVEAPADIKPTGPAAPTTVGPVDIRHLRFRDADGDIVPALLCTPKGKKGPFPLAVAVHGMNSNKAQVCGQVAPALAKRGFAVLAPDMPVHGERPGSPHDLFASQDWIKALRLHRRAIIDIRQCIDVAEARPELDLSKGVILAGYSMGSWLDSIAGPIDPRVKAMVLMVGGATDPGPVVKKLPLVATADPLEALPFFAGRPLLLLNGRHDQTVTPEMADRLFAAAPEPKEQKWYDSGHHLPDKAYEDAAKWVAQQWAKLTPPAATK